MFNINLLSDKILNEPFSSELPLKFPNKSLVASPSIISIFSILLIFVFSNS